MQAIIMSVLDHSCGGAGMCSQTFKAACSAWGCPVWMLLCAAAIQLVSVVVVVPDHAGQQQLWSSS
jgi:hypothetical protein